MQPKRIRPLALGLFLHDGKLLVFEGYDPLKDETFYRPLGGGIEFGETGAQAMAREIREEIGAEVANVRYLGLSENIFIHVGEMGHEIVLLYEAELVDKSLYERDDLQAVEPGGVAFKVLWKPLADFADGRTPLYPDGLFALLSTTREFLSGVSFGEEATMRAIELPELSPEAIEELANLYRTTHNMRLHSRAQMVLLAAEQHMVAADIAKIVRTDEQTVRRWLKRYLAEGSAGLRDAPHPGATPTVTAEYKAKLALVARQRPRSLNQPYSLWTCQRLADYMAEETGIRVSDETVRHYLMAADIVLSRPQHKITSPDPEYEVKKRRLKTPETA